MKTVMQSLHQESTGLLPNLLQVELTRRAARALAQSEQSLFVEMQLHYGCMLRKNLAFTHTPKNGEFMKVTKSLYVGLQSYMNGEACGLNGKPAGTDLSDKMAGTPRWLKIDYRKGEWAGEFGLTDKPASISQIIPKWLRGFASVIIKPSTSNSFNFKITV